MEAASTEIVNEQQLARSLLEKGEEAFRQNRHSEATMYFTQALKADPFNVKAHCKLSNVHWAQGRKEDALNSLAKALELAPADRETVLTSAQIFGLLGKKDLAGEMLNLYLGKNPHDNEIRSRLESIEVAGNPDRPEVSINRGDTAEFFLKQGEIQFGRGNVAHAAACFEMAIEEDPQMAMAYNNLGVISLESGKVIEALEYLHKALELKPDDADILGNSARGLARAAQFDAAIGVYREYLRRSPDDGKAWEEYETLIRRSGASKWTPQNFSNEVADIYLQTARQLGKAGDLTGAAEAVERALRVKPAEPESLYVLASLHYLIGQKDEAESILDQALKIDSSHELCSAMMKSIREGNEAKPFEPFAD